MAAFHGQSPIAVVTANGLPSRGSRVVVGEVVDQLLDADRVLRRRLALIQEAANVGVRRGVDVGGERGQRLRATSSTGCR